MKKTISIFALASTLVLSCVKEPGTGTGHGPELPARDSVWTVVLFEADWTRGDYRIATARRIVYDTVKSAVTDSTGGKIVQEFRKVRDTAYYVLVQDTVRDEAGRPIIDPTTLKPKLGLFLPFLPKERLLQDYNKDFKP